MEEYQTHNFWVPNTPEKSNSTKLQLICKDSGNSTNSVELENGFHNWEAALMERPLPDTSAAKLGDPNSMNNPSDSIFRTGFEGTRFEPNPSVENKFISVGQNMWINSNYLPSTPNGELTPPKHVLDLNTPFQELIEAVSNANSSSLFAPITPDQSKKNENNQACSTETINNQLTKDSSCDVASTQVEEKTPISKPRRKKHRPKVIKEGKPKRARKLATPKPDESEKNPRGEREYVNESDKIQSLPEVKETPKVKRKYVRKKIIHKTTEFVIGEALKECNDAKKESKFRERKSCKKRLNFDENSSSIEESSSCRPIPNENNFNIGETKSDRVREVEIQEQNESKKGKSQIVFSEKPHDKEEIIVENIMDNNTRPAPSLNNSNYSTATSLREREEVKEARGLKRGSESNINGGKQILTNVIEDHYKSSSNNVPLFPYVYDGNRKSEMYFSNIDENKQAKQRRRGGKEATNYTFNDTYIASYIPPQTNYGYHAKYYPNGYQAPTVYLNAHLQQQALEYRMILEHAKMMKEMVGNRGCSQVSCYLAKGPSQCGDLQLCESVNNSQAKVEIKVAKASKTGKKQRKIAGVARKKKPTVDDITEYLKYLEIDPTCNEKNKEKNALVLYNGVGTIVPFQGSFKPIKKRRERARVDLDAETSKVWRLLLENINNEGIDGTDEEKAKWWENERRVFQGRADSFIARMHLVQGDRRFTPWKGSVVDSVVGVFLTQNVSDHASSSAFMSMAAHFPIKIKDSFEPSSTETNIFVKEQKIQIHEPNSTLRSSNPNGSYTTFTELLQMAESKRGIHKSVSSYTENIQKFMYNQNIPENPSSRISNGSDENCASEQSEITVESGSQDTVQKILNINFQSERVTRIIDNNKQVGSSMIDPGSTPDTSVATSEPKKGKNRNQNRNQNQEEVDWDMLRLRAQEKGKREKTDKTMDSLDWEAVWRADVDEVADTIKARGMNNILAERIQAFLNRLVTEHGSIDLEWLKDVPPDKAKEYLLSIRGLGLKSVECVRLLTLHHLAFPVDTNVGRIAVRLGWVPLQPLPESLQLHLLELYPVLESIQQYLWPRLCKLDQKTLYELHYQMITFGKVFCTKSKPNCNACPMRGECRHFASAFASARLTLPGPEEKRIVNTTENKEFKQKTGETIEPFQLQLPEPKPSLEILAQPQKFMSQPMIEEPIIEVPNTPEPEAQILESDIEDYFPEDSEEIPTIRLNIKKFSQTLQNYMEGNMELQEDDMSKALVALSQEAASIPMPKLKNVNQLRTEHQVYELPDSHPLLEGLDRREPDDPCSYLLAIWTPGETANSVEQPENRCSSQDSGNLCEAETCFSCNSVREANSQTVRGTLLIPCRTATRGSFPLNGTYFQVNEVFADHASSLNPIDVPRSWIWNLPRRVVYFGTSIPTIFKGLSTETIQYCFWRGFVCVRGFDQKTRGPRPLMARLHFPASKLSKPNGKTDDKKI